MLLLRLGGGFQFLMLGHLELVQPSGNCDRPKQNDASYNAQAPFRQFLDWESHDGAPLPPAGRRLTVLFGRHAEAGDSFLRGRGV